MPFDLKPENAQVTEAWLLSKEKKEIQEKARKEEARKKKEADTKVFNIFIEIFLQDFHQDFFEEILRKCWSISSASSSGNRLAFLFPEEHPVLDMVSNMQRFHDHVCSDRIMLSC